MDVNLRVMDSRMMMDKVEAVKETINDVSTQYVEASFCKVPSYGEVSTRTIVSCLRSYSL